MSNVVRITTQPHELLQRENILETLQQGQKRSKIRTITTHKSQVTTQKEIECIEIDLAKTEFFLRRMPKML